MSVTIFIRSLWRNLQWEGLLVEEPTDELDFQRVVGDWFNYYNSERIHQALDYNIPDERWGPIAIRYDQLIICAERIT